MTDVPTKNDRERLIEILDSNSGEMQSREYGGGTFFSMAPDEIADVILESFHIAVPVEPEWEYGFRADDGPVCASIFGMPFESAAAAEHTGSKNYWEKLEVLRRAPGDEWQPATPVPRDITSASDKGMGLIV